MGTRQERWAKGGYEYEVRITIRCTKDEHHAKVLRFDGNRFSFDMARAMAEVFTGQGPAFILPAGPRSPVGRCAVRRCGAELKATVEEIFNAEHS